jgi:hypothetical protein
METQFDTIKENILTLQLKLFRLRRIKGIMIGLQDYEKAIVFREQEKAVESSIETLVNELQQLNEEKVICSKTYYLQREINLFLSQFEKSRPNFDALCLDILNGLKESRQKALTDYNFVLAEKLREEIHVFSKMVTKK